MGLCFKRNRWVKRAGFLVVALTLVTGITGCQAAAPQQHILIISNSTGGNVITPGEGTFAVDESSVVELVAEPDDNFHFVRWSGDVDTVANVWDASTTITVQGNYTVAAEFGVDPEELIEYELTTSSTTGGSVTVPGEGTFSYEPDTVVDLVAVADGGSYFVNWTGDVGAMADPGDASTTITMNDDYSITANFEPLPPVKYSVTINSTEGGEVATPGEGTFTCGAGTVMNLLAVADEHYEFNCWTGDVAYVDDIYAAETAITVWGDYSVTANFELTQCTLTIDSSEGGEVTSPGAGTYHYLPGEVVDLVVVTGEHYRFVGWTGDIEQIASPTSANTTISMWSDYCISAEFEQVPAPVIYSVEPNSGQPKDRLTVTIFGANFEDRPSIDFGERIVVQDVTFVSASQLEVRIMVHNQAESGPRDVTVTNPDGLSATLPGGFAVL
jgi:hypothetical protein